MTRRSTPTFAFVAAVCVMILPGPPGVHGQSPLGPEPTQANLGTLEGRITDGVAPVYAADVLLYSARGLTASTTSLQDGRYRLSVARCLG